MALSVGLAEIDGDAEVSSTGGAARLIADYRKLALCRRHLSLLTFSRAIITGSAQRRESLRRFIRDAGISPGAPKKQALSICS